MIHVWEIFLVLVDVPLSVAHLFSSSMTVNSVAHLWSAGRRHVKRACCLGKISMTAQIVI